MPTLILLFYFYVQKCLYKYFVCLTVGIRLLLQWLSPTLGSVVMENYGRYKTFVHFLWETRPKLLSVSLCMFCTNLMKLAAVFQDLEHLSYFQLVGCCDPFAFQNKAKIFHRQKKKNCRPGLPMGCFTF